MEYDPKEEKYSDLEGTSDYGTSKSFEERTPFVELTGRPIRNTVINDDDITNLRIALALNAI
jgi:hypothetical protein